MTMQADRAKRHCENADLPVGWRTTGSGESGTVLMLHSIGIDGDAFDALRAALPASWRIVTFDMRGHGRTDAPTAAAEQHARFAQYVDEAEQAAQHCGVAKLHLVGHSMGGAIAATLAAKRPAFASLTVMASPPAGFPAFAERAADVRAHGMHDAAAATLSRWFGEEAKRDPASTTAFAYAQACLERQTIEGFAQAWDALAEFPGYASLIERLPKTLLLAGEADLSTPPAVMRPIRTAFEDAGHSEKVSEHTVAGAGHMLPLTHAKAVAQALLQHWTAAVSAQ